MTTRYITPSGSGYHNGTSWSNAGTLDQIDAFIAAVGPGGVVSVKSNSGPHNVLSQIAITHGGTPEAPVTIIGRSSKGYNEQAEIVGTRPSPWTAGAAEGNELFRLMPGADNLRFMYLKTKNFGNGVFRVGGPISNLTLSDMLVSNVCRFLQNMISGANTDATIAGLTISNVTINGYSQGAINLAYDTHAVDIVNVVGDSQQQNGGLYITGLHLSGTVHDVGVYSTQMKNSFGNGDSTQYWNGDGFTTERTVDDVLFEDTLASGNSDGGYDLKSTNTTLVNATADGNNENFRFWSDSITMQNGISRNPTKQGGTGGTAHLWMGQDAVALLDNFTFSDPDGDMKTLFNMTQPNATLNLMNTVIPDPYNNTTYIKLYGGSKIVYL